MSNEIVTAFQNIRSANATGGQPGYVAVSGYPSALQATELPALANNGKAAILGNNQAFFFVNNPKGNTDPNNMHMDVSKLKELISNVLANNTQFTLALDADVILAPERFVAKYQAMRPEADQAVRESMLSREAGLIAGFIQAGGIPGVVHEVIREKTGATGADLDNKTLLFLQNNFNVKGVQAQAPLQAAVWQVEGPQGALLAKQNYSGGTDATSRNWQIGTEPELSQLKGQGHEGASAVLSAVDAMKRMPVTNMTLGGVGMSRSAGGMQR